MGTLALRAGRDNAGDVYWQDERRPASAGSVPLLQHQSLIGTLCVFDRIPARAREAAVFEDQDVNLLVTLATEAGIAIENARLFRAAAQRADELAALREVGQAIARRLELSEVLEAIATGAMRLLGSQHSQILLWDEETQCLRYGSAAGTEAARVKAQSFAGSRGVNAGVARTREPLLVDDYQASPYALPEFSDVVATITTPVLFGERLLGILHVHTTSNPAYASRRSISASWSWRRKRPSPSKMPACTARRFGGENSSPR